MSSSIGYIQSIAALNATDSAGTGATDPSPIAHEPVHAHVAQTPDPLIGFAATNGLHGIAMAIGGAHALPDAARSRESSSPLDGGLFAHLASHP